MATLRRAVSPRWARAVLVLGVVLAVVGGGAAFAAQLLLQRWEGTVDREELLAPDARETREPVPGTGTGGSGAPSAAATPSAPPTTAPPTTAPSATATPAEAPRAEPPAVVSGPLTYLIVGTDRHTGNPGASSRADAIIIAHLTEDLREAYLISVPRDLLVPIPGHWDDKINAAFQFGGGDTGGAQLLSTTLNELTGIGFDGAAILDFGGFQNVVDAIGGVEICLEQPIRSIHTDAVFPAGCQHLTGAQALDLARQRYDLPGGDFDRGRLHQRLIRAMVDQAVGADLLTDPLRLDRTIRAVGDALTVDTGGVALTDLAFALRHLRPDRITGITLPSYAQMINGTSYVLADPAASGLFRAVRESGLAAWVAENPRWRND